METWQKLLCDVWRPVAVFLMGELALCGLKLNSLSSVILLGDDCWLSVWLLPELWLSLYLGFFILGDLHPDLFW